MLFVVVIEFFVCWTPLYVISVSGYCINTSAGSAEACQILAATVNSIMQNESSSNTLPENENENDLDMKSSFNFQELNFNDYLGSSQEGKVSTDFID
jgi:hypothetical protein